MRALGSEAIQIDENQNKKCLVYLAKELIHTIRNEE